MGLRIIERVREEYGGDPDAHIAEEINPFTNPSKVKKALQGDVETGSTPDGVPFSYADDEEAIGGGFLVDDDGDLNGGGFLPEGHDEVEVPRGDGELTIEDARVLIDSGTLNGSTPMTLDVLHHEPPDTDDSEEAAVEADLDEKVTVKKVSTSGKKAAATISGSKHKTPTKSPKGRAAPKRKAARKSETALKSRFFEHESDEDDKSDQGNVISKEVAVMKPAKRKSAAKKTNVEDKRGPSTRASARKSTQ